MLAFIMTMGVQKIPFTLTFFMLATWFERKTSFNRQENRLIQLGERRQV